MSKQQMLDDINASYAQWQDALAQVPQERLTEHSMKGHSVKDVIAHITWYEREMIGAFTRHNLDGSPSWEGPLDERNRSIFDENEDRELDDVLNEARDVHEQLLALLATQDEEDFSDPARFGGMPSEWTPQGMLASNTSEHYSEHERDIRAWLKDGEAGLNNLSNKAGILTTLKRQREEWGDMLNRLSPEALEEPGALGDWPFRDLITHLSGWRERTAARLEAAASGTAPAAPAWPAELEANDDVNEINNWIMQLGRRQSLNEVLDESRELLDRIYAAVEAIPEEDLLDPNRYSWMAGRPVAKVVEWSLGHQYREHGWNIESWLLTHGRQTSTRS